MFHNKRNIIMDFIFLEIKWHPSNIGYLLDQDQSDPHFKITIDVSNNGSLLSPATAANPCLLPLFPSVPLGADSQSPSTWRQSFFNKQKTNKQTNKWMKRWLPELKPGKWSRSGHTCQPSCSAPPAPACSAQPGARRSRDPPCQRIRRRGNLALIP